ncbi:UNVERIFIED_CONTAM: hypothetical protein NCL1_53461 [Trichonephila clavipes]
MHFLPPIGNEETHFVSIPALL